MCNKPYVPPHRIHCFFLFADKSHIEQLPISRIKDFYLEKLTPGFENFLFAFWLDVPNLVKVMAENLEHFKTLMEPHSRRALINIIKHDTELPDWFHEDAINILIAPSSACHAEDLFFIEHWDFDYTPPLEYPQETPVGDEPQGL